MVVVDDFKSGLLATVVIGAGRTLWSELEAGVVLCGTMA